jgi:hypothetical protein
MKLLKLIHITMIFLVFSRSISTSYLSLLILISFASSLACKRLNIISFYQHITITIFHNVFFNNANHSNYENNKLPTLRTLSISSCNFMSASILSPILLIHLIAFIFCFSISSSFPNPFIVSAFQNTSNNNSIIIIELFICNKNSLILNCIIFYSLQNFIYSIECI